MAARSVVLGLALLAPTAAFVAAPRTPTSAARRESPTSPNRALATLAELDPEAALADPDVAAVLTINTASLLDDVCVVNDDGTACIEFPPALTAPQRVGRALSFYTKVVK